MTKTYKNLGQNAVTSALTATALYTVPAATTTVISKLIVCNRGASPTTFRVSIRVAGATENDKQYFFYDNIIEEYSSVSLPVSGVTMAATDVMYVYVDSATVSFNMWGVELS